MVIKRDFRTLAPATQAELRRVAVAMVRAGKTRIEAAQTVGVNRRFVGQWVKMAAQDGEAAFHHIGIGVGVGVGDAAAAVRRLAVAAGGTVLALYPSGRLRVFGRAAHPRTTPSAFWEPRGIDGVRRHCCATVVPRCRGGAGARPAS